MKHVSVRTKVVLAVICCISLWGWLDYMIQQRAILPSFIEHEHRELRNKTQKVKELIDNELFKLNRVCYDWATWDDSYRFVTNPSQTYIDSNLVRTTFVNNNINLILYINKKGQTVWQQFYNISADKPYQDHFWNHDQWNLEKEPFLQASKPRTSATGLMKLEQGILLVACRPILHSSGQGPVNGRLVMGRFLQGEVSQRLNRQIGPQLDFMPVEQSKLQLSPDKLQALRQNKTVFKQDPQKKYGLWGHIALDDFWGNPVTVARIKTMQAMVKHGEQALQKDLQATILAGCFVTIILLTLLNRSVLTPLSQLSHRIKQIGNTRQMERLPATLMGHDEIGTLAREFDAMIARIQQDINQRFSMTEALRESEARMRMVLDTTPDAILTVDSEGLIENANKSAMDLLGYSNEQLLGKPMQEILPPDYRPRFQERLNSINLGEPVQQSCKCFTAGCEAEALHASGRAIPVHIRGCTMSVANRTLSLWTLRDISELKEMHEQLSHQQRLATIGQMGASVAHDIRNPLAGISSGMQLMLKTLDPDSRQRPVLEEMLSLVERIEHTVKQMLDYAKGWQPQKQRIFLESFIEATCQEIKERSEFANIRFKLHPPATKIYAQADPELLRQVLNNLLHNAQEAMPEGGQIQCRLEQDDKGTHIRIEDNGPGISEEILDKITQPFFSTKNNGTGLGLAICQKIVEAHGGSLAFSSALPRGTIIHITLPAANPPLLESKQA